MLELYFRLGGVTLLLVQLILILRDARDVRPAMFGALLAISLIDVVGADAPGDPMFPLPLQYVFSFFSHNTAIFIWWFSLSLFDDDFRLRRTEWAVALIWLFLGAFNFNDFVLKQDLSYLWVAYTRSAIALGLVAHIVYRALAGRSVDLIEERRRARTWFAIAISTVFLLDLISEFFFGFHYEPLWFSMIEHGLFFFIILWSVLWLTRFEKRTLMFDSPAETPPPSNTTLSAKEQLLHRKLLEAMDEKKAYLNPELTISSLAQSMSAQEHQVRSLINKAMGYRNFRAFLNTYRMKEAQNALADPEKAALPILTIAMDSGFASLSPFNRAFKDATGQTPSEWRKTVLPASRAPQN